VHLSAFRFRDWGLPRSCSATRYLQHTITYKNISQPAPNPNGRYRRTLGIQLFRFEGDYSTSRFGNGGAKDLSGRGPALNLDVYAENAQGLANARGIVMYMHPGCMTWGSREDINSCVFEAILKQAVPVVSISYRLTGWGWNASHIFEDVADAINYVAKTYPKPAIILWGESAGAQLALLAAYALQLDRVVGVIADSAQVDMQQANNCRAHSYCNSSHGDKTDSCWTHYSPITYVNASVVPTLLYAGMQDQITRPEKASAILARSLTRFYVPHVWVRPQNGRHTVSMRNYGSGAVTMQLWSYSVLAFIDHLVQGSN